MESFVVQLWVPGDDAWRAVDTSQLRGWVRHVATGTEARFTEDGALLDLLHAAVAGRTGLCGTARPQLPIAGARSVDGR